MLGFFGCLGNPPGGRGEKRGEFIDIKPMSKRERLIWKLVGIVALTLISVLLVLLVTVVVFHLLGGKLPS